MDQKKGSVFATAANHIPIKLLDAVILLGIVTMALLIPFLSAKGGFTVNFDSLGGTSVESQKLRYGDTVAEPTPPIKENCIFDGWYYDTEGKYPFDFQNTTTDKNITLFAAWIEENS